MSLNSKKRPSPNHTGPSAQRAPVYRLSTAALNATYSAKRGSTISMAESGYRVGALRSCAWARAQDGKADAVVAAPIVSFMNLRRCMILSVLSQLLRNPIFFANSKYRATTRSEEHTSELQSLRHL